jgi:hypothetical protein
LSVCHPVAIMGYLYLSRPQGKGKRSRWRAMSVHGVGVPSSRDGWGIGATPTVSPLASSRSRGPQWKWCTTTDSLLSRLCPFLLTLCLWWRRAVAEHRLNWIDPCSTISLCPSLELPGRALCTIRQELFSCSWSR